VLAPVALPALLGGGAAALPPLAHAPIHDDAHAVLATELALEIFVELRIVARHNEDLADLHHLLPALLDPEWYVHFAEQRESCDQVLLRPQAIAPEAAHAPPPHADVSHQRLHLELLGDTESLAIMLFRLRERRPALAARHLAQEPPRPGLVPALLVRDGEVEGVPGRL